jgi:apolipoprotein N-acyltransferase
MRKPFIVNKENFTFLDFCFLIVGASLYTLAFPPYARSWAAWLALAPLFFVVRHKSPQNAFLAGLLYGVLWCIGQGYWLYGTMTENFALSPLFSTLFLLANFIFFSGLPTGIVTSLSGLLMRRDCPWVTAVGVPALWVSGEFLRANPLFGVSWGILGYAQYQQVLLIQIADLTGVYGISFLIALSGYVGAELCGRLVAQRKGQNSKTKSQKEKFWNLEPGTWKSLRPSLGLLLGSVILTCGYGALRLYQYAAPPDAAPLRVALIQGDIPAEHRWKAMYYASTLLTYASVTSQGLAGARPDLTIWPEFAISFYLDKEPLLRAQLGEFARMLQTPLLLGAPRLEETQQGFRYYNSAYLFSLTGELAAVYDKLRLVPFAEYRPFSLPSLLSHNSEAPSEFTPGTQSTIFPLLNGRFGVTICYEAAYPSLTRRLVQAGARLIVNISNDTWLGETPAAVEQHFAMNVLRAVENRRALARVATAGISGFVDPTGRPAAVSTAKEGVMRGETSLRQELTVYTRWGDWLPCCCLGFSIVGLLWATQRASLQTETRSNPMRLTPPQRTAPVRATV